MPSELARLKRRRDDLLHRAVTRQERPEIMAEVRELTRRILQLEGPRAQRKDKR